MKLITEIKQAIYDAIDCNKALYDMGCNKSGMEQIDEYDNLIKRIEALEQKNKPVYNKEKIEMCKSYLSSWRHEKKKCGYKAVKNGYCRRHQPH